MERIATILALLLFAATMIGIGYAFGQVDAAARCVSIVTEIRQ